MQTTLNSRLEAFLEQQKQDVEGDDEDVLQCDDGQCADEDCLNCGDDDLDEEQVTELFKSVQKPFLGSNKDAAKTEDDVDGDE